ncbi:2Fe-2S iron-sulfur cluster-binding protein [Synechococcus sp. PCC 7502]|uniref:2Fe-2S iron-sulfur cluster-binding protein n=1 Tax=Synechococcus sp. PCC 7502 TaxID=1173263 RepID=UPI00143CB13C|nr:2Fe-2S iron-sulfur cluster-binding protein [Synechococcus sp. PCC 7502]
MLSISNWHIYTCGEYTELLEVLSFGTVDLLLLGNINQSNCREISQICRQEWQDLPIIFISHDPMIPGFYRSLIADSQGLGDVVSSTADKHDHFVKVIQNVTGVIHAQKQVLSCLSLAPTTAKEDLISLIIDGKPTTSPKGTQLLKALLGNQAKLLKACGGQGRCATCHVFVQAGMDYLTPPTASELMTLDLMGIKNPNARLACQCQILAAGVEVEVPKGKYIGSEAELESLIGKRAQQSFIDPSTGEILIHEGKLILRSALQKMQEINQELAKKLGILLCRKSMQKPTSVTYSLKDL